MGRWVKQYLDGTNYTGTDEAVVRGEASWRRSRNTGIASVSLYHNGAEMKIDGPGEFWQSDTYEAMFPDPGPSRIIKRRIMRMLQPSDMYFTYTICRNGVHVNFDKKTREGRLQLIPQREYGKWFVLELDTRSGEIGYAYWRSIESIGEKLKNV